MTRAVKTVEGARDQGRGQPSGGGSQEDYSRLPQPAGWPCQNGNPPRLEGQSSQSRVWIDSESS